MKQSADYSASGNLITVLILLPIHKVGFLILAVLLTLYGIDPTKLLMTNEEFKKVGNALGILSGSDAYHASADATFFSSSLPVLPHEKCKCKRKLLFKDYILFC